ncbi:MAG TPA: glutamyl-tRNA reductase [Gammaproteobacteria bacterium]|nr:glutamyl-tRNA reductase [Gammaproteobacteria bacterium]
MPIFALGVNHISAPVEVREQLAFAADELADRLRELITQPGIGEVAIVSTCNRTEIYAVLESDAAKQTLLQWLCRTHKVGADWLSQYLYQYSGADAVRHLLRVCAGLDSMVLGEPQILGQTKTAYQDACAAGTVGRILGRMFQNAFSVAKQVRTETAIGANPVSVAFAAVSLAKQIFGDMSANTAMLIGAGDTIELCARHLKEQGVHKMIIANRTVERAEMVAAAVGGEAIALGDIANRLAECDIVISSTASPVPVLGKGTVERAIKRRRHRLMFMVDLAVPRDIEPEVEKLKDVYLYTVDDLRDVIDENLRSRQQAAVEADEIVSLRVERFMAWQRAQDGIDILRQYREQAERDRDLVLERALRRLAGGEAPADTLAYLAHTLTNRLIHTPTTAIRAAAEAGDREHLAALSQALDISDEDKLNP